MPDVATIERHMMQSLHDSGLGKRLADAIKSVIPGATVSIKPNYFLNGYEVSFSFPKADVPCDAHNVVNAA